MELRKRHKAHARPLKNLEERYDWYARAIELEAPARAGAWIEAYCPAARELHLDLGCGKGQFAVAQAQRHPDVLFVGLDYDRTCIALAAQKACELELGNCVFALADGEDLATYFGPGSYLASISTSRRRTRARSMRPSASRTSTSSSPTATCSHRAPASR